MLKTMYTETLEVGYVGRIPGLLKWFCIGAAVSKEMALAGREQSPDVNCVVERPNKL